MFFMHPQATVDRARQLSQQGLFDREVAQIVGVPLSAVQKWRTGARRAPGSEQKAGCPRCDGGPLDEPAYSYLLGLYLGDGCISRGSTRTKDVWKLSVACADAWPGLIQECARAIRAVRPGNKVLMVQRTGCTEVKGYSRHWPCLFAGTGRGGNIYEIEFAMAAVIVERYPESSLAGCFTLTVIAGLTGPAEMGNCDHWYEYPRYLFVNESADILGLCGETLDRLGVEWRFSSRTRSRWRSGTRWRGWTSSSGRSTENGLGPRQRYSASPRPAPRAAERHQQRRAAPPLERAERARALADGGPEVAVVVADRLGDVGLEHVVLGRRAAGAGADDHVPLTRVVGVRAQGVHLGVRAVPGGRLPLGRRYQGGGRGRRRSAPRRRR